MQIQPPCEVGPHSAALAWHECAPPEFIAAAAFAGARGGMVFRSGTNGLGYYRDHAGAAGRIEIIAPNCVSSWTPRTACLPRPLRLYDALGFDLVRVPLQFWDFLGAEYELPPDIEEPLFAILPQISDGIPWLHLRDAHGLARIAGMQLALAAPPQPVLRPPSQSGAMHCRLMLIWECGPAAMSLEEAATSGASIQSTDLGTNPALSACVFPLLMLCVSRSTGKFAATRASRPKVPCGTRDGLQPTPMQSRHQQVALPPALLLGHVCILVWARLSSSLRVLQRAQAGLPPHGFLASSAVGFM